MLIKSYRDLEAWQIGMDFVVSIYSVTSKAYLHFVVMALGSLAETQTQLEVASRLRIGSEDELESASALAVRLRQVLHGLRRSLAARLKNESRTRT